MIEPILKSLDPSDSGTIRASTLALALEGLHGDLHSDSTGVCSPRRSHPMMPTANDIAKLIAKLPDHAGMDDTLSYDEVLMVLSPD